jgi:hypothetical protein
VRNVGGGCVGFGPLIASRDMNAKSWSQSLDFGDCGRWSASSRRRARKTSPRRSRAASREKPPRTTSTSQRDVRRSDRLATRGWARGASLMAFSCCGGIASWDRASRRIYARIPSWRPPGESIRRSTTPHSDRRACLTAAADGPGGDPRYVSRRVGSATRTLPMHLRLVVKNLTPEVR